jgi:predicted alpha/beta superfamily hydrolase
MRCGPALVAWWLFVPTLIAAQAARVSVTITVVTPARDSGVYVAGNLIAPAWQPAARAMTRSADGRSTVTLELPAGATLEYKFTRGSWATVERTADGADLPNRRITVTAGLAIVDTVRAWAAGAPSARASTRTGRFVDHRDIASVHLATPRTVTVHLPPGYDDPANRTTRYAVLYMHDGQNLFDRATGFGGQEWEMDETAGRLARDGRIEPLIIVGIDNTGARMTEYTPAGRAGAAGRSGEDYLRFIVDELKPMIDRRYRTKPEREHTGVAGSSLGGLVSLMMALRRPDIFGKAGVISASLFWNGGALLTEAAANPAALRQVRYWVDMGTREGGTARGDTIPTAVRNARRLVASLGAAGLTAARDYFYLEVPGGEHNERSWAARMDRMLVFLYPR